MGVTRLGGKVVHVIRRRRRRQWGRILIVNADDFGLSEDVNQGIIQAHERGIVTSASLMVRSEWAAAAAAYGRGHPSLSLGIHVDLGCWFFRGGKWVEQYRVVSTDDEGAVRDEVARQLEGFGALTGRTPTHLDSHQHVHRDEPVRSVLLDAARKLNIPLRSFTPGVHYCGSYYGQTAEGAPLHDAITVQSLMRILVTLPPGISELGCHPALGPDVGDLVYRFERVRELRALCDPRLRKVLRQEGIETRSFNDASGSWWVN